MPWLVGLLLVLAAAVIVPDSIARLWWFRLLLGIALLPSVTVIGALRFRLVMQGDELQQRIELLAMGLTFVGALSALLLLMLLDIMDMHIRLQPLWVFWAFFGSYLLIGRALRGHYK